jgi:hypothetical protein
VFEVGFSITASRRSTEDCFDPSKWTSLLSAFAFSSFSSPFTFISNDSIPFSAAALVSVPSAAKVSFGLSGALKEIFSRTLSLALAASAAYFLPSATSFCTAL